MSNQKPNDLCFRIFLFFLSSHLTYYLIELNWIDRKNEFSVLNWKSNSIDFLDFFLFNLTNKQTNKECMKVNWKCFSFYFSSPFLIWWIFVLWFLGFVRNSTSQQPSLFWFASLFWFIKSIIICMYDTYLIDWISWFSFFSFNHFNYPFDFPSAQPFFVTLPNLLSDFSLSINHLLVGWLVDYGMVGVIEQNSSVVSHLFNSLQSNKNLSKIQKSIECNWNIHIID